MSDSFIDNIIEFAETNNWCTKFGCSTCGAYKFRAEVERAASNQIINKSQLSEAEKSKDFYLDLEKLASDISKNRKPITSLNKQNRLVTDLFILLQNEVINCLKISKVSNFDAIRIILIDYDLENNAFEFEGTPVGGLIKYFIRQNEEINEKLIPKPIRIIAIDVKEQKISHKIVNGPINGNTEPVEIAIGESDRETVCGKIEINEKQLGIIFGCGSRDDTGHFWSIKETDNLIFGNTAILCEDDTSIAYGPFYGQDCPLELEELMKIIVWGKMSMDGPEYEWTREATVNDIMRNG